jgi:hypothetical protein
MKLTPNGLSPLICSCSFGFATQGRDFRLMEDLGMKFWLEFEHPALVSASSLFGTFWNHLTPLHNSSIFHDFV